MKKFFLLFFLLVISQIIFAQPSNYGKIPLSRLFFHENVEATQKKILLLDRKDDNMFTPTSNESLNQELTNTVTKTVNNIKDTIEADSSLDNNNKIKFLRGLNETLLAYISACRYEGLKYSVLPELLHDYVECMNVEKNNQSIESNIWSYPYEIGKILIHTIAFSDDSAIEKCNNIVILKYCSKYPDRAITVLSQNPNLPFTDSVISAIARRDPETLYNYAASTSALATKIRYNPDTLVHVISTMALSKTGRQLFPFLDNIYHGKITFDEINAVMDNDVKYYKLLVRTQIDYADRVRMRDTPMGMVGLLSKLEKKAIDPFINTINGLHDVADEKVRFKILEPLNAQDLYYMAIVGEEVIYTSSYVKGVYPRVWQHMEVPRADSLLMSVRFDHFKKWIKMAANYNTLDDFLKRMEKPNAQLLMKAFANNLDKTTNLEDAVDVANSYASINDSDVQQLILNQVKYNLDQAKKKKNVRGTDIYGILNTLFLSMDTTQHINISEDLGIPPVYYMPVKNLQDSSRKIIVQQFFYGDKDGQTGFNGFLNKFHNANWKTSYSTEWVNVSSARGIPVVIYSNKPLDEKKNLDAKAQSDLNDYLATKNLEPTLVIHRGHSYWLPSTINQLSSSGKVIFLGSCGGYQSLDKILKVCPTAQIIASKQTGSGLVNQPIIYTILEELRQGHDLNWPQLWTSLSKRFGNNELFDDYVPPHKNLGALLIMAYKKQQEKRESQEQVHK
ncbi:MAG TPA: hypothetical protein VH396_08605 [Chitinophagaceae bacterium]|jgi:hypothetical protein